MPLETLLDIAFHFTGAVIEETLISWKPAARSEKLYEKLQSFQGKSVIVRSGEFLAGGKFKFDSTYEVESFKAELSDNGIVIYTADKTAFDIEGKTLSRIYTGQKGPGRICINTSKTDFLIDLIEIS